MTNEYKLSDLEGLSEEEYNKVLESKGIHRTHLLGILEEALVQNSKFLPRLAMITFMTKKKTLENAKEFLRYVEYQNAIVNRDIIQAGSVLEQIEELAEKNGYQDIINIFHKTYYAGFPTDPKIIKR